LSFIACVVFDIDDTLYLERDYVRSGIQAVDKWLLSTRGIVGFADRAWSAFGRGIRGTIFNEAFVALHIEPNPWLLEEAVDVYRNHAPDIVLLADAVTALDEISSSRKLAIVTDGPSASQRAKIRALRLDRWAAPIVIASEGGDGWRKPARPAFQVVERYHSVRGPACAYVADNPANDFEAPSALGWRTLRIRRPKSLHAELESGDDVDVEIEDLHDLATHL
jgi:putative hydrolase of the HAD superfamily